MLRSLDHVDLGTVIYTEKDGIIFASDAFARIVGHEHADLFGKRMEDFTHPEDQPANRWLLESAINNRLPFTLKKRYIWPNKSIVWVENHYQILEAQADDVVVCLLSRRLDVLPEAPELLGFPEEDASDYVQELSLDLSAIAALSKREMAADLLRLVAKVAKED